MNNIMKATCITYVGINILAGLIMLFIGVDVPTALLIYTITTSFLILIGITQYEVDQ